MTFPKMVSAFKIENGQLFSDEKEAIRQQRRIDFANWYALNPLPGVDRHTAECWLAEVPSDLLPTME